MTARRQIYPLLPAWPVEKAAAVLVEAQHQLAAGGGTSDRTLGRLAALADPDAAASRESFVVALERAGWSRRRVNQALATVVPPPSAPMVPRPGGGSTWTLAVLLVERAYWDRWLLIHGVFLLVWPPLVVVSVLVHLGARLTGERVRRSRAGEQDR